MEVEYVVAVINAITTSIKLMIKKEIKLSKIQLF